MSAEVTAAAEDCAICAPEHRCALGPVLTRTIAERDRARDIAVALEGQVARLTAILAAALDPDPADRGAGTDGGAA